MRSLSALARTARTLPARQWVMIAEAVLMLLIARICLLLFRFRTLASRFGESTDVAAPLPEHRTTADAQTAKMLGQSVAIAARRVPFRAVCLQQALAAALMLRRRGLQASVFFGVSPADAEHSELKSHAWVRSGAVKVVGYPVPAHCIAVARFD